MPTKAPLPARVAAALGSVRRRRRAMAVLQAMAWTCLGLAVLVLGAAVANDPAPAGSLARWIARLWFVASLVLPVLVFVAPPWRRTGDLAALARAVDDRAHATDESMLTAVDLARALEAGRFSGDPETLRLAGRQLDDASRNASGVDARTLVPWSVLAAARQAGPVGLVLLVAAFAAVPEDTRAGLDRLLAPVPAVQEVVAAAEAEAVTLVLRNVSVRLTPPAYSKREPLDLQGTTGDFQALPGTEVILEADSSASGRSARLFFGDEMLSEADPQGKHLKFQFKTPARGSGTYRVRLKRGIGGELVTRSFRVDALPDKAPELEVLGPTVSLELRPGQTVPLEIRTSDDFGLTRLERVMERGGREVARFPVAAAEGLNELTQQVLWDPVADLAGAGGELALFIESYDNDTVNGPKMTRSRPVEIYIPTARDQHRKVLALQEQLLGAALDLLAEILVDHATMTAMRGEYVERATLLDQHDREERAAAQLFVLADKLSEVMRRDTLSRPMSYVGTGRVVENIGRRWSSLVEYVEREVRNLAGTGVNPAVAARLGNLRDDAITELEQGVLDLADFIDLDRASDASAELSQIDSELSDLAELLREGADGGLAQDEEINEALDKLEESMAELAEKLAQRRGGPDDGFQNRVPGEADKGMRDKIRKLVEEGRYEEALALIQQAQQALAKLADGLDEEMATMAGSQESEELNQALQEAIDETRALAERQRALRDETEQLAARFGSGDGIDPKQQAKLLAEMDTLLKEIAAIPDPIDDSFVKDRAHRWVSRAGQAAERMRSAFAEGGVEEAIALGLQARRELEAARQGLELGASGATAPRGLDAAQAKAGGAVKRAQGLIDQLQAAQERAERQRSQAGKGGEGTRRTQNGLAGDLAGLRRKVERMGGSAFNPVEGRDNLRAAEDLMLRAGSRLEQGRPGRAGAAQAGAIQQLEQFEKSLEQSQNAMKQGGEMPGSQGMAMGGAGGRTPNGRGWDSMDNTLQDDSGEVEMPEPEDFVGPEAFRELVMEGAQDDAPERYRPLNGSYYEELVR